MEPQEEKRHEKLSIYYISDPNKENEEIIKLDGVKSTHQLKLPNVKEAVLYIRKQKIASAPTWSQLFTDSFQVERDIFGTASNVGAVLLVRFDIEVFILSFGLGYHLIKNEVIERDFGLMVTLNSVDPDKLRSIDKSSYDHNPLNSRTQSSREVDIFNLLLDYDTEMLQTLTGTSRIPMFGAVVTGRDSLSISVPISLEELPDLLRLSSKYYRAELPAGFKWISKINRLRERDHIEILNLEVQERWNKDELDGFWIGEPEIVDWENQQGYGFDNNSKTDIHPTLNISDYIKYLEKKSKAFSIEDSQQQHIHVFDNEYKAVKSWSVYRCIYAEIKYDNKNYVLRNGTWYEIEQDFVSEVDEYLKKLKTYPFVLPTYDNVKEEVYNEYVSNNISNIELLDKKLIHIGGPYDKLEHCDLIRNGTDFIHVKYYTSSATLSHLFSQGFVAAEAFIKDQSFREGLNPYLPNSIKLDDPKLRPEPSQYSIVYAIATDKQLPNELPFFSKVTLKNSLKTLYALNYNVYITTIDVDPEIKKYKKNKPQKNKKLCSKWTIKSKL